MRLETSAEERRSRRLWQRSSHFASDWYEYVLLLHSIMIPSWIFQGTKACKACISCLETPEPAVAFRFLLCGVEKAREGSLEDARRAAKDRVLRDFGLPGVCLKN